MSLLRICIGSKTWPRDATAAADASRWVAQASVAVFSTADAVVPQDGRGKLQESSGKV